MFKMRLCLLVPITQYHTGHGNIHEMHHNWLFCSLLRSQSNLFVILCLFIHICDCVWKKNHWIYLLSIYIWAAGLIILHNPEQNMSLLFGKVGQDSADAALPNHQCVMEAIAALSKEPDELWLAMIDVSAFMHPLLLWYRSPLISPHFQEGNRSHRY